MANPNQPSNIPQSFAQAVSIELSNAIVALAAQTPQLAVRIMQDLQRKADYYTRKSKANYQNHEEEFPPSEPGSNG